tara:strand:+ start:145 stop:366 length:222 start_codon:yes stop_codon:yes gene_type:complete
MKKYIDKIEKLVKKRMAEKEPKKNAIEQKGFMARKEKLEIKDTKLPTDLVEIVVDAIVHVRKKRMEMKNGNAT